MLIKGLLLAKISEMCINKKTPTNKNTQIKLKNINK